jgi:hypothetical protein
MPSLAQHQSAKTTKMMLIGTSGSGKTGSLVSLVKAGYKLRILDFDNGLDSLVTLVRRECPDKLSNVDFVSLRDKFKGSQSGPVPDGMPTAFTRSMQLLDKWKDGDTDLGRPSEWGEDTVLVVDSLTFLSDAAFNWATALNPGAKDKRQIYGAAQGAIEQAIALLTSDSFKTNVIVTSHIKLIDQPDGTTKGFPTSVGNALSPKLPAYFNNVALCETKGAGQNLQRVLRTVSTGLVDLKSPASFKLAPELPIANGLADFFKSNRGQ